MDNMLEITALNEEARRRGMDYGKLVGMTNREQQTEIILKYERARKARLQRKIKKANQKK